MKRLLASASLLFTLSAVSYAQVLVGWNTLDNDSTIPPAAADFVTTQAANVSVSDWMLSPINPPSVFDVADLYVTRGYTGDTALDTTQKYTSFTLTVDAGYEMTLTSLLYSTSMLGGSGGPTTAAWGYRIDTGSGFGGWVTETFSLQQSLILNSADIQTWDFSDFTTTGTVEFGMWAWGGTINRSVAVISLLDGGLSDGLIVNGSVQVIPEPSTYALLMLCGLGLFLAHRRRPIRSLA